MEFIKQLKKLSIASIIGSFIVGIIFMFWPSQSIKFVSLAVGIVMIFIGVTGIVNYFRETHGYFSLVTGIILTICGIIVCVKYQAIISIIIVVFGIFLLATGLLDFVTSIKAILISRISGWITAFLSVVSVTLGVIAIFKSQQLTETLVMVLGAALIIYAVLDLISYFQFKKVFNDTLSAISPIESDAKIIDEKDEDNN